MPLNFMAEMEPTNVGRIIDFIEKLPRHKTKRWKRRKPGWFIKSTVRKIVLHCTATGNQDPIKTARYHVGPNHISKTGTPGLCYHDFIRDDGLIYHCNRYDDRVWHAGRWNKHSIGVTMAYKGGWKRPEEQQLEAAIKHIVKLCLRFKVPPKMVKGHREAPGVIVWLANGSVKYKKWCPGRVVDMDYVRDQVCRRMQIWLKWAGLYTGEIDGLWGRKSKKALKGHYNLPGEGPFSIEGLA
jgi:hypothetical protein